MNIPGCFGTDGILTWSLAASIKGRRDSNKGNSIGTDRDTDNNRDSTDTCNNRREVAGGTVYSPPYLEKK